MSRRLTALDLEQREIGALVWRAVDDAVMMKVGPDSWASETWWTDPVGNILRFASRDVARFYYVFDH